MFERFTEKARRTFFFARYEASQFGSLCIEPEFFLLAIFREDRALAMQVLGKGQELAFPEFEAIRREIERELQLGRREKVPPTADMPLSEASKKVMSYGAEEAERLGHAHIGTEHLLMGILRKEDSFSATLLRKRGVRLAALRELAAKRSIETPVSPPAGRTFPRPPGRRLAPRVQRAISLARYHAAQLGSPIIDTEHLLLGLIEESPDLETVFFGEAPVPSDPAITGEILEAEKRIAAIEQRITSAVVSHEFAAARAGSAELAAERSYLELLRKHIFESLRSEIRDSAPVRDPIPPAADMPFSPALSLAFERGAEEAERLHHRLVGSEHILAGLLLESSSKAAQILARRGVKLSYVREVLSRTGMQPPPAGPQEGRDYV